MTGRLLLFSFLFGRSSHRRRRRLIVALGVQPLAEFVSQNIKLFDDFSSSSQRVVWPAFASSSSVLRSILASMKALVLWLAVEVPETIGQFAILGNDAMHASGDSLSKIPHTVLRILVKFEIHRVDQNQPKKFRAIANCADNEKAVRDAGFEVYLDRKRVRLA